MAFIPSPDALDLNESDPSVAPAGKARIRFHNDQIEVSVDGGAFTSISAALLDARGYLPRSLTGTVNVRSFGATGDGFTDDAPAFAAAVASLSSVFNPSGGTVFIPAGTYRLASPVVLNKSVCLVGQGTSGWFESAILRPDSGVAGIVIEGYYTAGSTGARGDWSVIRGLAIVAGGKTATVHGIEFKSRAMVQDVYIAGFKGDGVHLHSDSTKNMNSWRIDHVRIESCDGHGIFVQGVDANAGHCSNADISTVGGYGIYDNSFLGNLYTACAVEGGATGAYAGVGPSAQNLFLGCYSESDCPQSLISHPSMIIGGDHGAPIVGNATFLQAQNSSPLISDYSEHHVPTGYTNAAGPTMGVLCVGQKPLNGGGPIVWHPGRVDSDLLYAFQYGIDSYSVRGFFNVRVNASQPESAEAFLIAGPRAQSRYLRSIPAGRLLFRTDDLAGGGDTGFFLGEKKHTAGETEPVTGSWECGDICHRDATGPGQGAGWRCIRPGTFQTYTEGRTADLSGGFANYLRLSGANTQILPGQIIQCGGARMRVQNVPTWLGLTAYQNTAYEYPVVVSHGNVYVVTVAGTSAADPLPSFEGGPSGTGSDIVDGTVRWAYVGPASSTLRVQNIYPDLTPPVGGSVEAISYPTPVFEQLTGARNLETLSGGGSKTPSAEFVAVDSSVNPTSVTLPTAAGNSGKIFNVKKTDSTANAVTVAAFGGDLIEGAASITLSAQFQSASLVCDGTGWLKW